MLRGAICEDSFSIVVVDNDFAFWRQILRVTTRKPQQFRSVPHAKAMYGVYDGHGPAGHDCSDLSLRREDVSAAHPLDLRK